MSLKHATKTCHQVTPKADLLSDRDRLAATQIIEANLYEFMKSRVGVPQQGVCSAWAWFVGDDVAWSVGWQDAIRKAFKDCW